MTDELEHRFASIQDTVTVEEQAKLDRLKQTNEVSYAHDLIAAIQRGYHRKIEAAFDDVADLIRGDLYLKGVEWTPEKLLWHVANRVFDWGVKRGVPPSEAADRARRIADNLEREAERQARKEVRKAQL